MTNPDPGHKASHLRKATTPLLGLLMVGVAVSAPACSEPPPPPPPPPPVAPPPPPDPSEALRRLDSNVQFPEENLPSSLDVAEAIVAFANTFKGGDRDEVASVLSPASQDDMRTMITAREWAKIMERVEAVRVCVVEDFGSSEVRLGLGIQEPDGAYLLGWEGSKVGGAWQWEAVAVGDPRAARVAQLDANALPAPEATDDGAGVSTPGAPADDSNDNNDGGNDNNNPSRSTPTTVPTGRPGR